LFLVSYSPSFTLKETFVARHNITCQTSYKKLFIAII
jgi:hypothetical protein